MNIAILTGIAVIAFVLSIFLITLLTIDSRSKTTKKATDQKEDCAQAVECNVCGCLIQKETAIRIGKVVGWYVYDNLWRACSEKFFWLQSEGRRREDIEYRYYCKRCDPNKENFLALKEENQKLAANNYALEQTIKAHKDVLAGILYPNGDAPENLSLDALTTGLKALISERR